ncbi:MAG TPA: hypothetical protein VGY57_08460 [Vicinamibacterales bacterium]|nr:hypothetical protein [Vicinamibacterales bacterium]
MIPGIAAAGLALLSRTALAQDGLTPLSSDHAQERQGTSNNRLFGALPDFLTVENAANVPPLTAKEKFDVTARSTFDIGQLLFAAGLAAISQKQNADPSFGRGAAGYGKRFGLEFADLTVENFLTTAVLASVLHEDPRYFRLGKGNVLYRAGYSVSRIFVTRNDAGRAEFNFSEILGSAAAAGVYNSYHPSSDRTLSNGLASWWMQIGFDTGFIVIREFWPDVRRKFHKHGHDAPTTP